MKQIVILAIIIIALVLILVFRGGTPNTDDATPADTADAAALERGLTSGTTIDEIDQDLSALTIETDLGNLDQNFSELNQDATDISK